MGYRKSKYDKALKRIKQIDHQGGPKAVGFDEALASLIAGGRMKFERIPNKSKEPDHA